MDGWINFYFETYLQNELMMNGWLDGFVLNLQNVLYSRLFYISQYDIIGRRALGDSCRRFETMKRNIRRILNADAPKKKTGNDIAAAFWTM